MAPEDLDDEIPESSNPGWMARTATILVVILLVLAAYFYLDSDKGTKDPSQLPLITENQRPEKTKPADPGGMDIPHQDASVYDHLGKDAEAPEAEKLMPSAEVPVTAMNATAPPSMPANLPDALPSLPAAPPEPAPPPQQAAAAPAQPPAAASENTASDLAKIVQQAAAANAPVSTDDASARIQLGAVTSQAAADAEWTRVKAQYSDALKGLDSHFSQVNLGDKGEFIRIQTDAISTADATARCQKLKSENQACMVVKAAAN
jgi:hypothetical protein